MEKSLFRRGEKSWTDFTVNLQYLVVCVVCFYYFSLGQSWTIVETLFPTTVHGSVKSIYRYILVYESPLRKRNKQELELKTKPSKFSRDAAEQGRLYFLKYQETELQ